MVCPECKKEKGCGCTFIFDTSKGYKICKDCYDKKTAFQSTGQSTNIANTNSISINVTTQLNTNDSKQV